MIQKIILLNRINNHIEKCHMNDLYTLFDIPSVQEILDNHPSVPELEYLIETIIPIDNEKNCPIELGLLIEELVNNNKYIFGIYETTLLEEVLESTKALNILEFGIPINGKMVNNNNSDLTNTISIVDDIIQSMNKIKQSFRNKISTGAFLVKIPNYYFNKDNELLENSYDKVYYKYKDEKYIKPEYVVGYIGLLNGKMHFYSTADILENTKVEKRSR